MTAVIKVPNEKVVNRQSVRQRNILAILSERGAWGPIHGRIGHLPRTGQIIGALYLDRSPKSYASVSRSLDRLRKAGLVDTYSPEVMTPGAGFYYALTGSTIHK